MAVQHVPTDELRARFCAQLSDMFRQEVPLYGDLVDLVGDINSRNEGDPFAKDRVLVERHGAIRLGTAEELAIIARLFRLFGMFPVGYYDLSTCGLPVHATAFRPVSREALAYNPFRVFTSLLRFDLIQDAAVRAEAARLVEERRIIPETFHRRLVDSEQRGGVSEAEADDFILHAAQIFRWHDTSLVDRRTYDRLLVAHPLVADIAGFRGPHLNHLTPRVLDIDQAQSMMGKHGLPAKQVIEGPPKRACPILLRQTSFQALSERVRLAGVESKHDPVLHRARFGEIELRGCALTPKGHALYMRLMSHPSLSGMLDNDSYQRRLEHVFQAFPDDWESLRRQGLVYLRYVSSEPVIAGDIDDLVASGRLRYEPIEYEDFLPASAAGIFRSNLEAVPELAKGCGEAKADFIAALGNSPLDADAWYKEIEIGSLAALGLTPSS